MAVSSQSPVHGKSLTPSAARPGALSASGSSEPGFAVYVHWPFCAQKCPYCDFNSHVRSDGWDEERFLAAYLRELDHTAAQTGPRNVASIFFGGGTPSLMQPRTLAAIIEHIDRVWGLASDAEITLEANPGSVDAGRFAGYRAAGANRVSLGFQSLRDPDLKRLGRIHTANEALAALDIARANFERISFDLIYARPRQTCDDWRTELSEALALGPTHLSLYQLTIEPGTPYAKLYNAGKLSIPPAEAASDLFELTQELTEAAGLNAYETSNHAKPGEESRHNLVYWRYGEYAGIGPGAHGRILSNGERLATATERHPETWLAQVEASNHGVIAQEAISDAEAADEMLMMGLRLTEGLDLSRLARIGGVKPSPETLRQLVELGVIERDENAGRLRAVNRGRFILNELVLHLSRTFVPVQAPQEPPHLQKSV